MGDGGGSVERGRAKVPCTHIAIIRTYGSDARDRLISDIPCPELVAPMRPVESVPRTQNVGL